MATLVNKLSSCNPREFSSNNEDLVLNKFERYYDEGYKFNFYNAFANIRDVKYKNYSIFYLTDEYRQSDITKTEKNIIKSDKILTYLKFGDIFLTADLIDPLTVTSLGIFFTYDYYGSYGFSNEQNELTNFILELKEPNVCNIYKIIDYKKYYLTQDSDTTVNFYTRKFGLSGIDFNYIYSASDNSLCLFRNDGVCKILRKEGNSLVLSPFTTTAKILAPLNTIKIDKSIYTNIDDTNNFTLVGYDESNLIPNNLIEKNIPNNFLLNSVEDNNEIVVLKNQLTQEDIFTSGNTLISSNNSPFYMKEMRTYTSIFNDIESEKDESLSFNYVFYNKSYVLNSGTNTIKAPDDLSPFRKININDTKFVESGAFSYNSPIYADKVYKLDNSNGYTDGQIYLCTWLSGSPLSNDKVWVDRYYYPDRIEKKNALATNSTFNLTYEDLIEKLVENNDFIKFSLSSYEIFDKKSDFVINSGDTFVYERLENIPSVNSDDELPICGIANINYFETLNTIGAFTLLFTFNGDLSNWVLASKRNNIDGGLKITKNSNDISVSFKLYDPSNGETIVIEKTNNFKKFKNNIVIISIDTINGVGYFNLNGVKIREFQLDKSQFFNKKILFGDFDINPEIDLFKIYTRYFDFDESLVIPYVNGLQVIDPLVITLPCGQRNSEDELELLQSVCNNQTFKSNHIDILIKNIELPENIKKDLQKIIENTCKDFSPITTEINKIEFTE